MNKRQAKKVMRKHLLKRATYRKPTLRASRRHQGRHALARWLGGLRYEFFVATELLRENRDMLPLLYLACRPLPTFPRPTSTMRMSAV